MLQETKEQRGTFCLFRLPERKRRDANSPRLPTIKEPFKPTPPFGFGKVWKREEVQGKFKYLKV